ncbi:hypothetical protein BKP64_10775 [Marinobacter salinus]|jgi:hypothetical protein|uniref:Uncharacterized protein n=1 Tax=Marinobacter salinus TaxID=1874317 RepID=A0A1D9GM39_9GAMM|nr:hypothetical protein [Marinobacter salinus]AOY88611.1 hypothetical protein BKP64_10775 [Marinobacter salinus]
MNGIDARTILSLNDQRDKAEASKREALLELAEMKHELQMLRHMKREILVCLLDRRLPMHKRHGSSASCQHTVSRIARIVRSAHAGN